MGTLHHAIRGHRSEIARRPVSESPGATPAERLGLFLLAKALLEEGEWRVCVAYSSCKPGHHSCCGWLKKIKVSKLLKVGYTTAGYE